MYYVIETNYAGPDPRSFEHIDAQKFEVCTKPARTNMSEEVRTEGWCGTSNDWAVYAHGEYETQEAAEDWIQTRLAAQGWRQDEDADVPTEAEQWEDEEAGVVARYRPGRYAPMTEEQTHDFIADAASNVIDADTTDERIAEIVAEDEEAARTEWQCQLDCDAAQEYYEQRRQSLRDDAEGE